MGGITATSSTLTRYAVNGELPENFWDFAAKRIKAFAFRDIDDSFEERSVGWVSSVNMFDSSFEYASYAAGDYIAMAIRMDERKVPAAVLKKYLEKEVERVKKERQVPKLSRSHRLDIKENVKLQLTKQTAPAPAVHDMTWNLSEGTVLFFSTNKRAREIFEELFKETFGLTLAIQIPYAIAGRFLDEPGRDRLSNITPSIFA